MYLERDYDSKKLHVCLTPGGEAGWLPGLHRTYWSHSRATMYSAPMFTLKLPIDSPTEAGVGYCYRCSSGTRHRCYGCGRFQRHTEEGGCLACYDRELSRISRMTNERPDEEEVCDA